MYPTIMKSSLANKIADTLNLPWSNYRRRCDARKAMPVRRVHMRSNKENEKYFYVSNYITTAKYNALTFIPKFVFEQLHKAANLFFLCTSIIQMIPDISPTSRFTTAVPFSVVMLLTLLKEGLEDYRRHQADKSVNSKDVKVLTTEFVSTRWECLAVGDIVRLSSGENIPADIVVLSSSEPDGLCYVETCNLDGETNLKIKQARKETAHLLNPNMVSNLEGTIECEHPNNSLYTFEGRLYSDSLGTVPLTPSQLLLRGATLRNTNWVYGVVVYTGHDAKLLRNASAAPIKSTSVDRVTNLQVLLLFGILIFMFLACSILQNHFIQNSGSTHWYLVLKPETGNAFTRVFWTFLTFVVLYNNLIPISLIVTMELVRSIQAFYINNDIDMHHEETNVSALCRTSSLVEELGQVEFIFSDKTGTLTCNIMEFKKCCIGGVCFGGPLPDSAEKSSSTKYKGYSQMLNELRKDSTVGKYVHHFLLLLSTCHTVIPEAPKPTVSATVSVKSARVNLMVSTKRVLNVFKRDHSSDELPIVGDQDNPGRADANLIEGFLGAPKPSICPKTVCYQASSPDEGALVSAARSLGFAFHTRRPTSITVRVQESDMEVGVLNICEFNSSRKRMSAVLRLPDNSIVLYCKGADTVILERVQSCSFIDETLAALEGYATEGLRTLCLAYRIIPEEEYQEWAKEYDVAAASLVDRQAKLDAAAEKIEQNMVFIGATAVEDKLQEGVPETIATLQTAGIKIWVLTGDRQETAVNIGYSCRLLSEDMNLLFINFAGAEETKAELERLLNHIRALRPQEGTETELVDRSTSQNRNILESNDSLALIIDGHTLTFALQPELEDSFFELATMCKAVICCRVSPLQKALVVQLVKRKRKAVLLAIGDGANDVSMIQAAHVGVGISGQEGMQAAKSADFAISQFKHLKKLLLVHGSWTYQRLSKIILYSFYKNITLYMTQFWFAMYAAYSGQTVYESWLLTFYNLMFTALPPVALGMFDQFVNARMLDRYPQMYMLGQRSEFFNVRTFWSYVFNGLFHSLLLFYFISWSLDVSTFNNGVGLDLWIICLILYTNVLLTVLLKAALIASLWTKFVVMAIFGSLIFWFLFLPIYSTIGWAIVLRDHERVYLLGVYWLICLILPITALLRDILWKFCKRQFFSRPYHIVQEIQKYNIPDYRPRMERFRQVIHSVRVMQRLKRARGFAFSQGDSGQVELIRVYDTTRQKPIG